MLMNDKCKITRKAWNKLRLIGWLTLIWCETATIFLLVDLSNIKEFVPMVSFVSMIVIAFFLIKRWVVKLISKEWEIVDTAPVAKNGYIENGEFRERAIKTRPFNLNIQNNA